MKVDLRSDTVTQPSLEMREFMANAPVGDDVFGEDPSINKLEEFAADYFGMDAALFCTSGTQTNQIAINVHCRPGDEVICSENAHIFLYEGGGIAKISGASVRPLKSDRGKICAKDIEQNINNPSDIHTPLTRLISIEDTTNRGGGAIYDFESIKEIRALCDKYNFPLHLDGARALNALAENNIPVKEYTSQFDSISICLSKGLGAPVGSLLLGSKDFIKKARRIRKVLGGGMRQAGIIAAGGLFALQNNVERLKNDHASAKKLENCLNGLDWIEYVLPVETNIVVAKLKEEVNIEQLLQESKMQNVYFSQFGPQQIRMVTHLDINSDKIEYTIKTLEALNLQTH